jgi:inner membrane protein
VLALVVLPFVVAGALLLVDKWLRRRRHAREPARVGPLLALAAVGVVSHPMLDWLNNYGLRWLMPFDGRWFYGDALFILDPWVWLALGGVLFLACSRRPVSLAAWAAFWLAASLLISITPLVPLAAKLVWAAGLALFIGARFVTTSGDAKLERATVGALALIAVYMLASVLGNLPARAEVRQTLAGRGIGPVGSVMVAPAAGDPFSGTVVAATPDAYYLGSWNWFASPRFALAPEPIERIPVDDPIVAAAARTTEARRYLTWSRVPYFIVERDESGAGHVVHGRDARYGDEGRLGGPTVRVEATSPDR